MIKTLLKHYEKYSKNRNPHCLSTEWCIFIHMLKSVLVAIVLCGSLQTFAQETSEVVVLEMAPKTDSCIAQIIKALEVADDVALTMDVSANLPTEEYTDYLVNFAAPDRLVVATMRCYKDGRTMERVF